jgi:SAM-dependent methyltransferase
MPSELLLSFYPERYYKDGHKRGLQRALSHLRVMRRARAVTWRAQKGSALDVGCGRGALLGELKRLGWNAVGTDWNAANAQSVSERLGVPVLGGENALEQLSAESFQAASLLHVLEHENQPVELLRKVHRVLANGGRLLIGVPNGGSLSRAVFGRFWLGYDMPRHRWVFTRRSLQRCLESSGFRVERVTGRLSDEWLDILGSSQLYCRARGWTSRVAAAALAAAAAVPLTVASFLGFGSVAYVYARKT